MKHLFLASTLAAVTAYAAETAQPAAADQAIPEEVVRRVDPSVVAIQHEHSGGSGFIVSKDGYILTNGHVVMGEDDEDPTQPARAITVILNDERKYPARVLGFSLDPDVALIKIEPEQELRPVEDADSRNVRIGERCFAVGMPVGLKRTFTGGLLSNVDRTDLGTETKVFQTDAAINPGNSGGPLFDRTGRVLGLNTYAMRGNNNIGFTIPIHVARTLQQHFLTRGHFERSLVPLFDLSELYDELAATVQYTNGMLVTFVMNDSPAFAAGLRAGDLLVATDGQPCHARTRAEQLDYEWDQTILPAGTEASFTVLRGAPGHRSNVVVRARREALEPLPKFGRHLGELPERLYEGLGLGVRPLVRLHRLLHNLPATNGVLVTTADRATAAQRAGLREFDVITRVAGRDVTNIATFAAALDSQLGERPRAIELTFVRGRATLTTALAPYYPMRDQRVLLVLPGRDVEYADLLHRELLAAGARVEVGSPGGVNSGQAGLHPIDLTGVKGTNYALVLLAGGAGSRELAADTETLRIIREASKGNRQLAAVGPSSIALIKADPDLVSRKMTTAKEDSAKALALGARYTGADVETDGRLTTTTGFDRETVRRFLKAVQQAVSGMP